MNWKLVGECIKLGVVLLICYVCLLMAFGCSVLPGIGQMSDRWCAAHPEAAANRCAHREVPQVKQDTTPLIGPNGLEPPEQPDGSLHFPSLNEAAVWALVSVYKYSFAYEWGGVILKLPDGTYGVKKPVSDHSGNSTFIDTDPEQYAAQGVLAAQYHTHPCLDISITSLFSPEDLSSARVTNLPTFIADLCTGKVHRWDPGDPYLTDVVQRMLLNIGPWDNDQLAPGKIVGQFPVTGTILH